MNINGTDYNNLFDIVLSQERDFINLYDMVYEKANRIFSLADGVVALSHPAPPDLVLSLVSSLYLYTDFYINSISVDMTTDALINEDMGGLLYDSITTNPNFWVRDGFITIMTSFTSSGSAREDQMIANSIQFLQQIHEISPNLLLFILNTYFDGLARYAVKWQPNGQWGWSYRGEVFTVAQKDSFKDKCLRNLINKVIPRQIDVVTQTKIPDTISTVSMKRKRIGAAKLKKFNKNKKTKKKIKIKKKNKKTKKKLK
tara:strand:- start:142 stop:912 length:771 start_codon:yes stop_codon:yes gene_type:complete